MDSKQFYRSIPQICMDYKSYVILIDDDPDDLEMLSSILQQKDVSVKAFQSPVMALVYLKCLSGNAVLPSLIIVDYNMPQKNGYEVLLSIKENNDTKNIPVVIHSTNMPHLLKKKLSDAGAFGCFSKPWTYQELAAQAEIFQELYIHFEKMSRTPPDRI
jgi:response regulator RpfG family c-di-GMP phosphodiesterase